MVAYMEATTAMNRAARPTPIHALEPWMTPLPVVTPRFRGLTTKFGGRPGALVLGESVLGLISRVSGYKSYAFGVRRLPTLQAIAAKSNATPSGMLACTDPDAAEPGKLQKPPPLESVPPFSACDVANMSGVGVGVGVKVGLSGVDVGCGVGVRVGSGLGVRVGVGVSVGIGLGVAVDVGGGVMVAVGDGVGVRVGVLVAVGVGVWVAVGIGVSVGSGVAVGIGV